MAKKQTQKNGFPEAGSSYKRIINKNGVVMGYLKGGYIYDLNLKLWRFPKGYKVNYSSDKSYYTGLDSNYIFSTSGKLGCVDNQSNVFDIYGRYFGTIQKEKRSKLLLIPILFLICALVASSIYFSSKYMGSIGQDEFDDDVAVIYIESLYDDDHAIGIDWTTEEELDILNSSVGDNIIMPGASGTYYFGIENLNDFATTISLVISDINDYDIPMCYRLKLNNVYIAGSDDTWVDISALTFEDMTFSDYSRSLFTLEWWWDGDVSDEQDTVIGITEDSSYTLIFNIEATS